MTTEYKGCLACCNRCHCTAKISSMVHFRIGRRCYFQAYKCSPGSPRFCVDPLCPFVSLLSTEEKICVREDRGGTCCFSCGKKKKDLGLHHNPEEAAAKSRSTIASLTNNPLPNYRKINRPMACPAQPAARLSCKHPCRCGRWLWREACAEHESSAFVSKREALPLSVAVWTLFFHKVEKRGHLKAVTATTAVPTCLHRGDAHVAAHVS